MALSCPKGADGRPGDPPLSSPPDAGKVYRSTRRIRRCYSGALPSVSSVSSCSLLDPCDEFRSMEKQSFTERILTVLFLSSFPLFPFVPNLFCVKNVQSVNNAVSSAASRSGAFWLFSPVDK